MIKKILVTGSSGMIGTGLCEQLLLLKKDIIGVDKVPNRWNKQIDNITIKADLSEVKSISSLPKDIDCLVHLAANARVYDLINDPQKAQENINCTFNILEYCRISGVKKIIFASSREVYGNTDLSICEENNASIDRCESPYAASKISCEALVRSYRKCFGLQIVILRFSNVYGRYDDSDRVIPLFIKLSMKNADLNIYGKDKVMDFTYLDDSVNGIIAAIDNFNNVEGKNINIASGKGTSVIDLANLIKLHMKSTGRVISMENRTGEVVRFVGDISLAKKALGWNPDVEIEEGIKRSINWYVPYYTK